MKELRPDSWANKLAKEAVAFGAFGLAALPVATMAALEHTEVETTFPIGGERTVTVKPSLGNNADFNLGPHGTIRTKTHGLLGTEVEIGPVRPHPGATPSTTRFIDSIGQSFIAYDKNSLESAARIISDEVGQETAKNLLFFDLLGATGLYAIGLYQRRQGKQTLSPVLAGGIALGLFASYATLETTETPPEAEAWQTIQLPEFGAVKVNDANTYALLREILPALTQYKASIEHDNRDFLAEGETGLAVITKRILADRAPNDALIVSSSDEHFSEVMLSARSNLVQLLDPDLSITTGDLSNFDNPLEASVIASIHAPDTRTVGILGNHDGKVVEKTLDDAGVVVLESDEPVTYDLDNGQTITIFGANDPRYTAPFTSGWVERNEGDIAKTIDSLKKNAPENPDILLMHNPNDIETLNEMGISAPLELSGHAHLQSQTIVGNNTYWISQGALSGGQSRTVGNILSPLGTPTSTAYINVVLYDTVNNSVRKHYVISFDTSGNVHMIESSLPENLSPPTNSGSSAASRPRSASTPRGKTNSVTD